MSRLDPLRNLYLARLREFYRQPARIFWVYGFPIVLAIGLGLASKKKAADSVPVRLVANDQRPAIKASIRRTPAQRGASARRTIGLLALTASGARHQAKKSSTSVRKRSS